MEERCSSLYCRELNRIGESRGESVVQGDFVIRFQSAASNPQLQAVCVSLCAESECVCACNVCMCVIAYGHCACALPLVYVFIPACAENLMLVGWSHSVCQSSR